MAVTTNIFGKAYANLLGGEAGGDTFAVDYLTDTIKCMLCTNVYSPNLDTHETKTDVTNEVAGTNYVARGAALGTKTITFTAAASWGSVWTTLGVYAVGDIVKKVTTNGHVYRCIVAGTAAAGEPSWPTVSGQTVVDGTVTWAEVGRGVLAVDAADVSWASSTITARYGVVYKDSGTDGTSPLLYLVDFGADFSSSNGTFQITWHTLGLWVHTTP
jgi:hypothetical protein